eukprot:6759669-Prymnesium_polylepis.1
MLWRRVSALLTQEMMFPPPLRQGRTGEPRSHMRVRFASAFRPEKFVGCCCLATGALCRMTCG